MARAPHLRANAAELWQHAPVACLLLDRGGRIHDANAAALALSGRGAKELVGLDLAELFSPPGPLAAGLRSRASGPRRPRLDGTLSRPGLGDLPVGLRLHPLPGARPARLLAWLADHAEEHRLRGRLERSERLSAMAIVAGKVSHEIRSPLNSIFLNNDLLQERVRRMRGPQGQRIMHYCRVLEEEVERLNEIVESYLALARLAGGDRQPTDVGALLESFAAEVGPDNQARSIILVTALRARPALLQVNQRQFRRVLLNLLANSRDAMKSGGVITMSTEDTPQGYRVTVSDTGEGIPPEALSRLTTPFTTYKENGSGLGLFLAREIVQQHGGRLEIQSVQGEGTSVLITLPYA